MTYDIAHKNKISDTGNYAEPLKIFFLGLNASGMHSGHGLNVSSKSWMHSGNGLDASPDKSAGCIQAMACMLFYLKFIK
jgi:hypothetical protein